MDLSFTIAAGPRLRSNSRVRAPRNSWPCFTVSDSRLTQLVGPGPRIYIRQEQGGPVISPGTGSLFVASYDSQVGIRPRFHTALSRPDTFWGGGGSRSLASAWITQKTPLPTVLLPGDVTIHANRIQNTLGCCVCNRCNADELLTVS
jgi:hypothetical protein